jgi:hypothetical protein
MWTEFYSEEEKVVLVIRSTWATLQHKNELRTKAEKTEKTGEKM